MITEKISLKNLTIDEFTTPCPISVGQNASIKEVMEIMEENDIRHIPVTSGLRPVGLISDRDIRPLEGFDNFSTKFSAYDLIRNQTPLTVRSGSLLSNVAFEMSTKKFGSAIVINEKGHVDGILTTTDMLNAVVEVMREIEN